MIKNKTSKSTAFEPLVQVTIQFSKRREKFGALARAMDALRPVVAVTQAIHIFEKTFGV
jgi:hypothetical protein